MGEARDAGSKDEWLLLSTDKGKHSSSDRVKSQAPDKDDLEAPDKDGTLA